MFNVYQRETVPEKDEYLMCVQREAVPEKNECLMCVADRAGTRER